MQAAAGASPANEAAPSASKRTRRPRKERNADKAPEQANETEKKGPALAVLAPESQSTVAPQVCTPHAPRPTPRAGTPRPTPRAGTLYPLHGWVGSGQVRSAIPRSTAKCYDCLSFVTEGNGGHLQCRGVAMPYKHGLDSDWPSP
jgi:hypothetical protein